MAIESRKQAASRPKPAVAQTGVGLLLEQLDPIEVLLPHGFTHDGIQQQVGDIVGQRAADEKLHREVIDALGVLALVGVLGEHPPLRKDVPDGAGEGLKTIARVGAGHVDDVVKQQMPLIQAAVRAGEVDRTAPVLLEKLPNALSFVCARVAVTSVVLICVSFDGSVYVRT